MTITNDNNDDISCSSGQCDNESICTSDSSSTKDDNGSCGSSSASSSTSSSMNYIGQFAPSNKIILMDANADNNNDDDD